MNLDKILKDAEGKKHFGLIDYDQVYIIPKQVMEKVINAEILKILDEIDNVWAYDGVTKQDVRENIAEALNNKLQEIRKRYE